MKKLLLFIVFCFLAPRGFAQSTCATAVPVGPGLTVVDAIDGTQVPQPVCVVNGTVATAGKWYSYTPVGNYTTTVTTDLPVNIGDDPRVHIYKGSCDNLICVAGDDDSGILGNPDALSVATFTAMSGNTYYIAFDNKWDSGGITFKIIQNPYVVPPLSVVSFSPISVGSSGTYQECVVDMDGDHLDDIVSVSNGTIQVLKQNPTTGFTTVNMPAPTTNFMPGWSIAAGDIDNNGKTDLLYGNGQGVCFMKQNDAGTGFTSMQTNNYVFSQRSNFVDLNNDGHLDAFVCHDVDPNVYFTNDGLGNYTFHQGGMGDLMSGGNYGSIFVDYDNDGDADLFIAKCGAGPIDELHRNNGDGTFTDVSVAAGMNEPSQSWSSAWGDFDNDGDMDAMIGASSMGSGGHKLRRNNGDGTFTDVTVGSGLDTFNSTNIENVAHDFNNDGWVDLFMGGNTIMINNGNMTFTPNPINTSVGPIGDLNHDGFLDIRNGSSIYLNNGNDNNWLAVSLEGIESNKMGIGARLEIHGDWGMQIRDLRSGDGFAYMSSLNVHFGIGESTAIDKLVIRWPSGLVDEIQNPSPNQRMVVLEGSSPLSIDNPATSSSFTIFPNPVKDVLRFEGAGTNIASAKVYDLNGRLVLSPQLEGQSLNVQKLAAGTYILLLKTDTGKVKSSKFIRK